MSLQTRIQDLATRAGTESKALRTLINGNAVDLSALNTTDKTNLVNAINEVLASAGIDLSPLMVKADNLSDVADVPTARTNLDVRSSGEITTEIATAIATVTLASLGGLTQAEVDARVQLIVGAAPAALDTLVELGNAIGNDANFASTITTALSNRLQFDAAQTLTAPQQQQAQDNLQVYSRTEIGDPDTNYVTVFETALT